MEKPAESSSKKIQNLELREFLNLKSHQGLAAIQIQGSVYEQETQHVFVELGITISDCRRTIDLDFCFGDHSTQEEIQNLRHKLDTLINAFEEMESWLEQAIEQVANAPLAKES